MRAALLLLALAAPVPAQTNPIPPDVDAFVRDRDLCDHFLGEPAEGRSPAEVARRDYVIESVEIYCPGTDRRLAALKRRYAKDAAILKILNAYEERIGL